jgi:hypothetical protein
MALKLEIVPDKVITIRRGSTVVSGCWFGPFVRRPYIYPFVGPQNLELTRLDHPLDPISHSHHKSIWVAHADVGGVDFWSERKGSGTIVQEGISEIINKGDQVGALLLMSWRDSSGKKLLVEKRRLTFTDLPLGQLALDIDTTFEAASAPVTLGKTNFGILGIRVARTMRVHEGLGGIIYNSGEAENEDGCFGQHADWCDYSGPVPLAIDAKKDTRARAEKERFIPAAIVGVACFSHPSNSKRGTQWHVRDDGWIGPGLTRQGSLSVRPGAPVRARYRIESHSGRPWQSRIGDRYRLWASRVTGTSAAAESSRKRKKP